MYQINFHKAEILTRAENKMQFPFDMGAEIAFFGRSNSGKSSALRILINNKKLARVSKTPGRTQLLNFFSLDKDYRLVDLPGYGYAKVALLKSLKWDKLLNNYLRQRRSLVGAVLIMDSRHPLKSVDQQLLQIFNNKINFKIHIIMTKTDKLSKNKQIQAKQQVIRYLKTETQLKFSCQLFSAIHTTQQMRQELQDKISYLFT